MPVLLLARGDQPGRTLLRRAIEARYGLGPPAIETLKLDLKGRARTHLGPVATWIPLDGIVYLKFPFSIRWNFTLRSVGVSLSHIAYAFDDVVVRNRSGHDAVTTVKSEELVASARARAWAANAILLTPLAEHYVELHATGERSFDALHSDAGINVRLQLGEDHTLDFTATDCINPETNKQETYTMKAADGTSTVDGLILPRKIVISWGDQAIAEITPQAAQMNLPLNDSLFRLESD